VDAQKSLVVGSTGLVGKEVINELASKGIPVRALSRIDLNSSNPYLENIKVNFDRLDEYKEHFREVNDVYICLGTTISKAGSQEAFQKVDIEYCLETAKQALNAGVKNLSLITSIGADSSSSNFYLKTKGIIEDKISQLDFQSISIHRPGLLIGSRKEMRLAELIGQKIHPAINLLLLGNLSKYKSIKVEMLARAMVNLSGFETGTKHYYYNDFVQKGDD
tara:strand:+ start:319 stop:978 length:660 start_codon:yes stop_codon:yes gene_type:complete